MNGMTQTPIESLVERVLQGLPDLAIHWDVPEDSAGVWHLDMFSGERHVVVQWQSEHGFGMATGPGGEYGEGPEYACTDEGAAEEFVLGCFASQPPFVAREAPSELGIYANAADKALVPVLSLVVLRSSDIDRAARFYTALGLHFSRHAHGNGPQHFASEGPGPVFEIYPKSEPVELAQTARIGFEVQSVDALMDTVQRMGGTIKSAPKASPWGRRAVVTDPDGHVVELMERPETECASGG